MNRSLLIAICDFLILSLISMGSLSGVTSSSSSGSPTSDQVPLQQDILDSLKMVLDQEQSDRKELKQDLEKERIAKKEEVKKREELSADLSKLNLKKEELERILKEREERIKDREKQLKEEQERLAKLNSNVGNLNKDLEKANQELLAKNEALKKREQVLALTQKELESLEKQAKLRDKSAEDKNAQLTQIKQQLAKRAAEAEKYRTEFASAQKKQIELSQKLVEREKHVAGLQRIVAVRQKEVENYRKEIAQKEKIQAETKKELETVKVEKKRLEKETKILAGKVTKIAQDNINVRKEEQAAKPLSDNELFQRYLDNEVKIRFKGGGRITLFYKKYDVPYKGVVVTDGDKRGVLMDWRTSPLNWTVFPNSLKEWRISLSAGTKNTSFPLRTMRILKQDPRIVFIEVPNDVKLPVKEIGLHNEGRTFDTGLLVRAQKGKYGSFKWKISTKHAGYIDVPTSLSTRLFGSLAPKPGDVILTPKARCLAIMVTSSMALRLKKLEFAESFEALGTTKNLKQLKASRARWHKRIDPIINPQNYRR